MKKFAIISVKNSQYKVSEGDVIEVDNFAGKAGDKIKIKEVLLIADQEKVNIGKPYLEKSLVDAEIQEHFKGKKVDSLIYKAKARYRRRSGNRPSLTKLKIIKIS